MPTIEGVGGSARELLQQQSVKAYMMPVRKVGARGTELSYMLASCLEYYVNLDKNYKLNLSPDYITLSIETMSIHASHRAAGAPHLFSPLSGSKLPFLPSSHCRNRAVSLQPWSACKVL